MSDSNEQKDAIIKKHNPLAERHDVAYMLIKECMKEYAQQFKSENTALKLEVETGQGIVLKLLKECEDRKLEVERLKEALKKILSHADPYDQEGNVFISIAEQALK